MIKSMSNKISKILIANRGEIAIRIMHTAKKLGIKTVAIYSTADSNAKFVTKADEKFHIPGFTSKDTYLNIPKIIEAIKFTGADSVHPGYGFLSEKSEFVRELEKHGINFIGPSAASMDSMGDKIMAKTAAIKAGVPVVPGIVGKLDIEDGFDDIIKAIGFPMIIKAASGGGGKGMKIVYEASGLKDAAISAQNEARNSFGDDTIFIEKYIEKPRHIEIQILADKSGNVVCLGERECSIQRFNQKVIEEAPSSFLTEEMRAEMYKVSINLVKECGYFSAGTIEYIVDQNRNFYFLEMNTRLQVEHPVTEYITGLDLVEQMIKIAQNEKLKIKQENIKLQGWAFESRICAEDPSKNFMPSVGRITEYQEPTLSYNVRVDSGVEKGSEVSPYYDAMITKVITYGDSRTEAIMQMRKALSQFQIDGIATNISMIEAIMRNEKFIRGDISTWFIKEEYPDNFKGIEIDKDTSKFFIISGIAIYIAYEKKYSSNKNKTKIMSDTLFQSDNDTLIVVIEDKEYIIEHKTQYLENGQVLTTIKHNGKKITLKHRYNPGDRVITGDLDGESSSVKVSYYVTGRYRMSTGGVIKDVCVYPVHISGLLKYLPTGHDDLQSNELIAPITGSVVKVKVNVGDAVVAGQELLIIEAMKMENIIVSERNGIISSIKCIEKDNVSHGDLLIEYK